MKTYDELRKINVNEHTEKKGSLTYLSWTWAVDQLLLNDNTATWEFLEPLDYNETMMVRTEVTAFGKTLGMQLPVMPSPILMHEKFQMHKCDAWQKILLALVSGYTFMLALIFPKKMRQILWMNL